MCNFYMVELLLNKLCSSFIFLTGIYLVKVWYKEQRQWLY